MGDSGWVEQLDITGASYFQHYLPVTSLALEAHGINES